jgi:uroporphyrinogen decarboxylase
MDLQRGQNMMRPFVNEKFKNAVEGRSQSTPPIWFMRQAGRYHQHYQKLKEKHDFMALCKVPELAAQVALGPIEDFDFDVSILFSDLLFPLEALGLGLTYAPGPQFDRVLTPKDLPKLRSHDEALAHLDFQNHAARLTRELLPRDKSLIGFVGGPWTLFGYAVAGGHDGHLIPAKTQMSFFDDFCERLVPLLIDNIALQFEGGVELVMIFDTSAGELDPLIFNHAVVPKLEALARAWPGRLGYYSKGTQGAHVRRLRESGHWAGFGFDHRWDLPSLLRSKASGLNQGFVQGNFDQALLFQDPDDFKKSLQRYLATYLELTEIERAPWVCGLGHGVLPKTPEANVRRFIETVRTTFA